MTARPADRLLNCCRAAARWAASTAPLLALFLVASLLLPPAASNAEVPPSPEYQLKAAFLYNFMKFVDWPRDGLRTPGVVSLGVLGRDPFGNALETLRGKLAKGRKVVVLHLNREEEAKECDVVFIAESEKARVGRILKGLQGSRALTVADQEGFLEAGGMINLVAVKSKIGFEVNLAAAERAGFHVSSQLLHLARAVTE